MENQYGRQHQYLFTEEDLEGVIGMFLEWRDVHGEDEENARFLAVHDYTSGYDAQVELFDNGESPNTIGEAIQRELAALKANQQEGSE